MFLPARKEGEMFPMTASNRDTRNALNGLLHSGQEDRVAALARYGLTDRIRRCAALCLYYWHKP
jgi:hypothetical protein